MELVPRSQRNKYKVTTRIERTKSSRRSLNNWLGVIAVFSCVGIYFFRQYWLYATLASFCVMSLAVIIHEMRKLPEISIEPLTLDTTSVTAVLNDINEEKQPVLSPRQSTEQAKKEAIDDAVSTTSDEQTIAHLEEAIPKVNVPQELAAQCNDIQLVKKEQSPATDTNVTPQHPIAPLFMNLFARPVLGLDVGNSQIKIVELLPDKKPRIQRYAIVPTPRGSVENGIVKKPDELAAAINEALNIGKFTTRKAATTLTGQNLMLRELKLPPMPKKEMRAAINWQVDQLFQLSKEDIITDFTMMPKKNSDETSVMLVAMHREPIVKFVDYLNLNGFNIARVDIEPLSVYRTALLASQGAIASGTHLICDFGAGTTNISIFHDGVLQTARVLNIGGNQLTRQIMIDQNLEFPQAEALKIRYGLSQNSPIYNSLIPVRDRLFNEISATVNYYLTENRHLSIASVQVVGGNGILPSMAAQLEVNLRDSLRSVNEEFCVHIANPLEQLKHGVPAEQIAWAGATLSVAIGLALGEVKL